jgi:hypothetical protein
MTFPLIPSDNEETAKSEHPFVSERERLKTLGTMIQQMLLLVGATFVVQTQVLIKAHPYFYGLIYLCAITLFMGFFTFAIRQPPQNKILFECVFLMFITATMTVLIALIAKIWIGIASAIIWGVGIYFVIVESKDEFSQQLIKYAEPISHTKPYKCIYFIFGTLIYYCIAVPIIFVFSKLSICGKSVWNVLKAHSTSPYQLVTASPTSFPRHEPHDIPDDL